MTHLPRWAPLLAGSLLLAASCAGKRPIAPSPTPPSPLAGTAWRVVEFRGGDDTVLTPEDRDKYTIELGADGRVAARIDCNRGTGWWNSASASQLEFGPLALTRAACPAPLTDRLTKDWSYVRTYTMRDGHLFLSLMADAGIYELEPRSAGGSVAGVLKGTASYRERMALPPGAVLEVTLEDVSKADAAAEMIGSARVEEPGNPPIPFEIRFDPARIERGHRYVVRATIALDGKPLFVTDPPLQVPLDEKGANLAILLRRAAGDRHQ